MALLFETVGMSVHKTKPTEKQVSRANTRKEIMEKILSMNVITAIPGIGAKYAQRLSAIGINKVSVLNAF